MSLRDIQLEVGVTADGVWGPKTEAAIRAAMKGRDPVPATTGAGDDPALPMMIRHLRREEGVIRHAYQDHLGFWTIGVGRLIDKRKGGRLTDDEINMLLSNDIARFRAAMESDPRLKPAWDAVKGNPARETALLSMAFQMGENGLAGFKNTLAMIAAKNFEGAGKNMLASQWAKQTPDRAARVSQMIRTGLEA